MQLHHSLHIRTATLRWKGRAMQGDGEAEEKSERQESNSSEMYCLH